MSKTAENDVPKGPTLPNGHGTAGDCGSRRTMMDLGGPAPKGIPTETSMATGDDAQMRQFRENGAQYDATHIGDPDPRPRRRRQQRF